MHCALVEVFGESSAKTIRGAAISARRNLHREARLQPQLERVVGIDRVGAGETGPARCLVRRLRVETVVDHAGQQLQVPLWLPVAARRTTDQPGSPRLGDQEAVERVHRPLPASQHVRVPILQGEASPDPVVQQNAGIPRDDAGAE